ncbi:MAG: hypothetical protein ACREJ4_04650 [Candidatus Methylomirabilaceae bacterium]
MREVARASDRAALSPITWSPDGRRFAYGARDGVWVHTVGEAGGTKIADGEVVTAVAWSSAPTVAGGGRSPSPVWSAAPSGHPRAIAWQ